MTASKYTNNDVLTGTAMLSAMWSVGSKDVLDALMPFIRYAVGKETALGDLVDISNVAERLREELGYDVFPASVVVTALKRLARSGLLKREYGRYRLIQSLDDEMGSFDTTRTQVRASHERVGASLAGYLNEHILSGRFDSSNALDKLTDFFDCNGLMVSRNPDFIDMLSRKNDKCLYHVGQYILREYQQESSIFDEIEKMTRGFFVSTALYAQPTEPVGSRFKNTTVYIDTRIILCALGYHSPEEFNATSQLLMMLNDEGATLACFRHTVEEIESILTAYKESLLHRSHGGLTKHATLDGLNNEMCTPGKVDVIIQTLSYKINALGLEILDKPSMPKPDDFPVDEAKLRNDLSSIGYRNEKALQRDLDSVISICVLRGGLHADSFERCGALFLTANNALKRNANESVGVEELGAIPPVFLDTELGAMVWLKSYAVHGDYPRRKLIEDATLALLPTESIMQAFYEAVDREFASHRISREEYDALRFGLFQQRELMKSIDGDEGNISGKTVTEVVDALRERYRSEDDGALIAAHAENEASRREMQEAKQNALKEIAKVGEDCYIRVQSIGRKVVLLLLFVIAALSVYSIIYSYVLERRGLLLSSIVVLLLDLWGARDSIFGRQRSLYKLVDKNAEWFRMRAKDKERAKFNRVFGDTEG